MASTFYASADGTVFHPVSDEARKCAHDSSVARERLAQKLARRKAKKDQDAATAGANNGPPSEQAEPASNDNFAPAPGPLNNDDNEIAIRRIENRLRTQQQSAAAVERRRHQRDLVEDARFHRGNTKALPSSYVYKPGAADNKTARAIVHHTGSHYVMAGSRQFQRGVRVKGAVSRHSKQGARMQARRVAARNARGAREDARGQRAESSRSLGKQKKSKKKRKNKNASKAP